MPEEVTTQVENPEVAAQDLISQLGDKNPPSEPTETPAEITLPEGLDPDQFNSALKAIAGIEDYKKIPEIMSSQERYQQELNKYKAQFDQTQQELNKLKAQSQLNPYANPYVEKVNEMFKAGADRSQVARFTELHFMDLENMDPGDAIVQKLKMENPTFDSAMIERLMERQFGEIPSEDEDSPEAQAKREKIAMDLKIEGQKAKEWLRSQVTSFDNPQVQKQQEEMRQTRERYATAWNSVATQLISDSNQLGFELDDKKVGGKYHFNFSPKLDEKTKQELAQAVTNFALENNLPLTKESLPQLQQYQEMLLWTMNRHEFLKHMAYDMYSSLQKYFVEQYSGKQPSGSPEPQRDQTPPKEKSTSKFPPPPSAIGKDQFF